MTSAKEIAKRKEIKFHFAHTPASDPSETAEKIITAASSNKEQLKQTRALVDMGSYGSSKQEFRNCPCCNNSMVLERTSSLLQLPQLWLNVLYINLQGAVCPDCKLLSQNPHQLEAASTLNKILKARSNPEV